MTDEIPWTQLPVQERMARKFAMDAASRDHVEYIPPTVLVSEEITVEQLPKLIQDIAKQLYSVQARHSRTFQEGTVFKTGTKQGEKRPDKLVDHYSVGYRGRSPLTAFWSDGKLQYAKGFRAGEWYYTDKVTELRRWLKEGWE